MNVNLFRNRILVDVIKKFEMRLSRITVGPKYSEWCPKERGGDLRHRDMQSATCRWRQRLEGCIHMPRTASAGRSWESYEVDAPSVPLGTDPGTTLISGFSSPEW